MLGVCGGGCICVDEATEGGQGGGRKKVKMNKFLFIINLYVGLPGSKKKPSYVARGQSSFCGPVISCFFSAGRTNFFFLVGDRQDSHW